MVRIVINKTMHGSCPPVTAFEPNIREVLPTEEVEVSWGNSYDEHKALSRMHTHRFILYVPDSAASERALTSLEMPVALEDNMVEKVRLAIGNKKLYDWRSLSKELGSAVSKNALLKLTADEIRKGNKTKLTHVLNDIFIDGVNPTNADTLIRLIVLQGG